MCRGARSTPGSSRRLAVEKREIPGLFLLLLPPGTMYEPWQRARMGQPVARWSGYYPKSRLDGAYGLAIGRPERCVDAAPSSRNYTKELYPGKYAVARVLHYCDTAREEPSRASIGHPPVPCPIPDRPGGRIH